MSNDRIIVDNIDESDEEHSGDHSASSAGSTAAQAEHDGNTLIRSTEAPIYNRPPAAELGVIQAGIGSNRCNMGAVQCGISTVDQFTSDITAAACHPA